MRRAHFRVDASLNKAPGGTVTIEAGSGHALFTVRPLRRRRCYTVPLADVAAWVIWEALCREQPRLRNLRAQARRRGAP